jgi:probable HAF family extracellular repeat protein
MFLKKHLYPLAAAALIAAPVAALADPAYTVSFLPDGFHANFLGNNGLVAGNVLSGSGTAGAIFQGGSMTSYGSLGITDIYGVGSYGTFTGALQTPAMSESHAFIYHGGTVQDLGTIGAQYAYGVAINGAGQMAGQTINGPYGGGFLYSGGVITDLGTLGGGPQTSVSAMNAAGVIVGDSLPSEGTYHAYMYSGGVMTDLGGTPSGFGSGASDINNSGQIVGNIWDWANSGPSHAFLYTGGVMHDLGTFGGLSAYAAGINDSGLVVGSVGAATGGWGFLYNGATNWDLNTLVSGAAGWTIQGASAINGAGQILATACDVASVCRDVVLDPVSAVPEPATCAMLLAGLAGLAVRRRRTLPADPSALPDA